MFFLQLLKYSIVVFWNIPVPKLIDFLDATQMIFKKKC